MTDYNTVYQESSKWIRDRLPLPKEDINEILERFSFTLDLLREGSEKTISMEELALFKEMANMIIKNEMEKENPILFRIQSTSHEIVYDNVLVLGLEDIQLSVSLYTRKDNFFGIMMEDSHNQNQGIDNQETWTRRKYKFRIPFFDPRVKILNPDFPLYSFFERIDFVFNDYIIYSFKKHKSVDLKFVFENKVIRKKFEALDMSTPDSLEFTSIFLKEERISIGKGGDSFYFLSDLGKFSFCIKCPFDNDKNTLRPVKKIKLFETKHSNTLPIIKSDSDFSDLGDIDINFGEDEFDIRSFDPNESGPIKIPVLLKYYSYDYTDNVDDNTYLSSLEIKRHSTLRFGYTLSDFIIRDSAVLDYLVRERGLSLNDYKYYYYSLGNSDRLVPFDRSMPSLSDDELKNKYSRLSLVIIVQPYSYKTRNGDHRIYLIHNNLVSHIVKRVLGIT